MLRGEGVATRKWGHLLRRPREESRPFAREDQRMRNAGLLDNIQGERGDISMREVEGPIELHIK